MKILVAQTDDETRERIVSLIRRGGFEPVAVTFPATSAELLDVESNQKAWIGAHEIEKRARMVN